MKTTVTIRIDKDLLNDTVRCFGADNSERDYSEIIEHALWYFLKPQVVLKGKTPSSERQSEITQLLLEPEIDIEKSEKNYHFKTSTVEGQWPGDESVEELLALLHP